MNRPLTIAHRGGRHLWPENTIFALHQAALAGFDGAEIDVQLCRDGALVLFHDFRLTPDLVRDSQGHRLRPPHKLIRDCRYAELATLDVGRPDPESAYGREHGPATPHDGETMPRFADAVRAIAAIAPDFQLFVEIKTADEDRALSAPPEAVAEAVVAELRDLRFVENVVFVGFDWPALLHARKLAPEIPCWFTTRRRIAAAPADWAAGFDPDRFGGSTARAIAAASGQGWLCSLQEAGAEAVQDARQYGLKFGVWTVNAPEDMRKLAALGADAIVTDRPDLMREEVGR